MMPTVIGTNRWQQTNFLIFVKNVSHYNSPLPLPKSGGTYGGKPGFEGTVVRAHNRITCKSIYYMQTQSSMS